MLTRLGAVFALTLTVALAAATPAWATIDSLKSYKQAYPGKEPKAYSCKTCHEGLMGKADNLNAHGKALQQFKGGAGTAKALTIDDYKAFDAADTDGDGAANAQELDAGTDPTDPASVPPGLTPPPAAPPTSATPAAPEEQKPSSRLPGQSGTLQAYLAGLVGADVWADTGAEATSGEREEAEYVGTETCAACHAKQFKEFEHSTHARIAIPGEDVKAQGCESCHGPGSLHAAAEMAAKPTPVAVVRWFYWVLIALVIGGMVVHNLLDFLKKLRAHYTRMAAVGVRARMSLNVRVQHVVLTAAFVALAYTGFALKFPQAWWASPFVGHVDWRSLGHRTAAAVFCLLALYHAWYVLCTARGRHHVRALLPRRVDLLQPVQMLAYYLGLRRERPVFARYSYIEKAEYWALVWGSVIMTITGALMTWQNWTLRLFPQWLFDVVTAIHYYEAILACLAILVWHFYFMIFDPDEYPMKWTWLTGRPSPADRAHRKDDPHEPRPPAKS